MHEYVLVLIVAAAVTYLATPFVRSVAVATGAFTAVRERDVHKTPIPRLGGVGIYIGFVAAALVARALPYLGTLFSDRRILGVIAAGGIVCLLGAFDDIRELDWLTKLAGQMLAAGLMAYTGVQLLSLPIFGTTILPTPVLVLFTVLVVIASTNAVNFIDGLDGLAAGVVGIAAFAFFIYSYLVSRSFVPANVFSTATFICAALVGCCAGFLPHNFHPARLFMGDSGALTLGLLLSAATITLTGNVDPGQISNNACRSSCRWPSCCCRSSTWCSPSSGAPEPASARGSPTRCTCTTACCASATATAGPCSSSTSGLPSWPSVRCPSSSGTDLVRSRSWGWPPRWASCSPCGCRGGGRPNACDSIHKRLRGV